jgi:D-beta-D-heptose 7-phosphate kinase/D-beta-D-heptose 1-phosphate adenosyltransferase
MKARKKKVIVAVSGGFDPIHVGHIEMLEKAKKLGHKLVVILNNDNWLRFKKGFVFMPQSERKKLLESFRAVDRVVLSSHKGKTKDWSVCEDLRKVRPHIFGKGGDRTLNNIPEVGVCQELDIKMVFGLGAKVQSSSWLLSNYLKSTKNKKLKKYLTENNASRKAK